jgi:hypothetical protein
MITLREEADFIRKEQTGCTESGYNVEPEMITTGSFPSTECSQSVTWKG